MNEKILNVCLSVLVILFGNFLYAVGVAVFLQPSGIVTGGVTGISLAVEYAVGFKASTLSLIMNIFMWVLGLILLGRKFAASTLISTIAYPCFWKLISIVMGDHVLTSNMFLCTVFGGLTIGVALGLVIRFDSSTGGMDVVPLALNKYFNFPVSACMYVVDFIILAAQFLVFPVENVLYGIINILIYTVVLDKALILGTTRIEVMAISDKHDEIRDSILKNMDRGVTMLSAQSGYMHRETSVVMSVISNRELPMLQKLIKQIDPEALVIVNKISQVSGRGFTMERLYR